jgi:predicted protein tyrosine phosphatase
VEISIPRVAVSVLPVVTNFLATPNQLDEDEVFVRLIVLRPNAWPNSLMIAFAEELLDRNGRVTTALSNCMRIN